MKRVGAVVVLILAAVIVSGAVAFAQPYKVTVQVVGKDGKPLDGAAVYVYAGANRVASGTTNSTGYFIFEAENGTYLIVVEKEYFALDSVEVAGADVSKLVNVSLFVAVNATAVPISVPVNVSLAAVPDTEFAGINTNATIYVPSGAQLSIFYPEEVHKFVYAYKLETIKYGNTEATGNNVTLTVTQPYEVVATYSRAFAVTLPVWVLGALAIVVAVAMFVAWRVTAKSAGHIIAMYREQRYRFVRKRDE